MKLKGGSKILKIWENSCSYNNFKEESENATHTIIYLKIQVEEATRIKESISNSFKDKLEKSTTKIEKQSEEIVKLGRLLEDKEKE